ncbi:MAG: oligosaccharide flippase family protein [Bacillota bacterium]|nr:oligosaccharide flippase family protein [Bacillota bacterium]
MKSFSRRLVRSRLLRAAFVLFSAGAINRILGFVYRVALVRALGAEGVGLVQQVYPVFLLFLTLGTLGLTTGIAKMTAEALALKDPHRAGDVRRAGLKIVLPAVLVASLLLLLLAPALATYVIQDTRILLPLLALLPALVANGFSSVYRGFLLGHEATFPIALSQVTEQIVRVGAVLLLLSLSLPFTHVQLAAWATGSTALGEWVGLGLLLLLARPFVHSTRPSPSPPPHLSRTLLTLSFPVALAHVLSSVNNTLDAVLIPLRLRQTGVESLDATRSFGELVGMALPIVYLGTVLIQPLAQTLIPEIAEAAARRQRKELYQRTLLALALTLGVGGGMALLLLFFPQEVARLLYGSASVAPLLQTLAPLAPFLYLFATGSSILNGLGCTRDTVVIMALSTVTRVGFLFLLTSLGLGIKGAALAMGLAGSFAGIAAWWRVAQLLHRPPEL